MNDNDRALTVFTMLGHGTFHSYELVIPVFVVVWLDVFPVTNATLGLVVGASYALVGLGAIPSGMLADRFSSKQVILGCLLGMGFAFMLLAFASNTLVLAGALLLWGGAASLYHPAALALISRGTEARGSAFAYHGIAGNIGVATGPLLAALLLIALDWRAVTLVLVLPAGVATLVGLRLDFDETAASGHEATRPEKSRTNRSPQQKSGQASVSNESRTIGHPQTLSHFLADSKRLFTGGFLLVFSIGMLYGIYYRGLFTFLPDVLAGLSVFESSWSDSVLEPSQYVYSGLLLFGGLGQYFGGRLVENVPVEYALITAYLSLAGVAALFAVVMRTSLSLLLVVAGVLGVLVFMVAPINQEAIASYSVSSMRGLSFGFTYTGIFGVGALGATMAGVILSWSSPEVLFTALAGTAVLTVVVSVALLNETT
jgi:MFS family permease